jgi:spermidine synthase
MIKVSCCLLAALFVPLSGWAGNAEVVFERTSAYHHIRVIDQDGIRTLSFDNSMETRMSLRDPLQGHFEYTEYFHMPWLWNARLTNVLMIGLGGGSAQRSYAHYYPQVRVETVEIDPVVLQVARQFFHFKESPMQRVHVADGRVFLRRVETNYSVILMDAYVQHRYGSSLPQHLATQEFFELAASRLATNGVLAYNVIGTMRNYQPDVVGAISKTMKTVFPQIYFFPARESQNVVILGTKSAQRADFNALHQRASALIHAKTITLPSFRERLYAFRTEPPLNQYRCPVLRDDFAPIDGLLSTSGLGR